MRRGTKKLAGQSGCEQMQRGAKKLAGQSSCEQMQRGALMIVFSVWPSKACEPKLTTANNPQATRNEAACPNVFGYCVPAQTSYSKFGEKY